MKWDHQTRDKRMNQEEEELNFMQAVGMTILVAATIFVIVYGLLLLNSPTI